MERYLIGIDVGTTGTKSMLLTESGRIAAHAYAAYPCYAPGPGRVEQDAEDWWRAVVETVRAVTAEPHTAENVAAISLSLQGGTLVAVDKDLRPLGRAAVWSDMRCDEQAEAFRAACGAEYMYQKTGWHLSGGFSAMQIAWLRDERPDLFEKARMFLSVPGYLSLRMTGSATADISDAGIDQLADIRAGDNDGRILDFLGIGREQVAKVVPSGVPVGTLLPPAARELGLPASTLVVSGAHDQYAALLGAGVTRAGELMIGTGTAWVVTALTDGPCFESGFAQSISAAGQWGSLVSLSAGGASLDWFRNRIAASPVAGMSYQEINEMAPKREIGAGGLTFYPYFNGTAFPLDAPDCKGTLTGLDLSHDRYDVARAVMEGVAMQTAWTMEFFRDRFALRTVKLSGGAGKSPFWTQMMADIADHPIRVPAVGDLGCIGAGVMAGVGSGVFASFEEGAKRFAQEEKLFEPDPARAARYREKLEAFKRGAAKLAALYGA